jgi:hypothetical protein
MDRVMHIIGSDSSADMLCDLDVLAAENETIVSIGPRRRAEGFARKTETIRAPLENGALAAIELRRLRIEADLLHAWSPQAASAAQWSAKGRPIVLSLGHLRNVHQADIAISGCFDGLWTLTVPTAPQRRVLITLGLDRERVFVLPPAAPALDDPQTRRKAVREKLGLDDSCFLLAAGGEMIHANGHKQACWAHAMARIIDDRARLVYPSGGPARRAVETFAQATGYPNEVFFTAGSMPRRDVLAAADAAIFLQRHDCGVRAIAEAMACGLPILAADRPEIAHCAPERQAALLCPPGDMRKATDNILTLLAQAELRQSLARQAAVLAAEKFDPNTTRAKLNAIYSSVLSGQS